MVTNVHTCYGWLGTNEFVTNAVAGTVAVHQTLLLLTANFLIVWITEEAIGTGAHWLVASCSALSIPTTNDRSSTGVLAFKKPIFSADTGVCLIAVNIVGAP